VLSLVLCLKTALSRPGMFRRRLVASAAGSPYGILPGAVALEVILGASERAAAYIG
jgi:hypothetical protein